MSKPRAYEAKRIPASQALVSSVDSAVKQTNEQIQYLQQQLQIYVNNLAVLSKAENKVPEEYRYDHATKAWIVPKPELSK